MLNKSFYKYFMIGTISTYRKEYKADLLNIMILNTPQYFAKEEFVDFDSYLENELELYYVIKFENEIIGCGGINFEEDRVTATISWDMLNPQFQGQSMGAQLLSHRIKVIQTYSNIKIIKVRTSQFTFKFYEKQGFKTVNIIKNYWSEGFDLYDMEYLEKQSNNF